MTAEVTVKELTGDASEMTALQSVIEAAPNYA